MPVEMKPVHIHKGQTRSKEYQAKNPLSKVPFLEDGPLALPESAAILTYLACTYSAPDHWYPRHVALGEWADCCG
jgi:glutathione S-transferase